MGKENPYILAIESSCDETSAAVLHGRKSLSNIIASQKVHEKYGGVVPELASRAHQANIVPVVHQALEAAGVEMKQLDAVAFTQGPGLTGSLLVGTAFAKSMSLALNIPLIAVNHMQAHVLAHFIADNDEQTFPSFPFLCLTVSGGHTQIVRVDMPLTMSVIGETIDDAAGEAFDKAAKVLGLPYPGGPEVDKLARTGNALRFSFPHPQVPGFDYSFSGLKTSLLYLLRDIRFETAKADNSLLADICASYQKTIVDYLLVKFKGASVKLGITQLCLAGGVSANSELRNRFTAMCSSEKCDGFIPPFAYCTDNAAMIGIAAYFKFMAGDFASLHFTPKAKMEF